MYLQLRSSSSIRSQAPDRSNDIGSLRQHVIFEGRRVRKRDIRRRHAQHGSVQPLEAGFVHARRDLTGDATGARVLMNNQQPVRLLHCAEDRLVVHRRQRSQVEDFDGDPLSGELLGGLEVLPLELRFVEAPPHSLAIGTT